MTKKKSKRLLSFLLSLTMVFALVITPVYADESDGETTAETTETTESTDDSAEENEAAAGETGESAEDTDEESGSLLTVSLTSTEEETEGETAAYSLPDAEDGVITMTGNATMETLTISSDTTIDLAGYTLTLMDGITLNAGLTVKDSSSGGTGVITNAATDNDLITVNADSITVTIESGTLKAGCDGIYAYNHNGISVVVSGGTITTAEGTNGNDGIHFYGGSGNTVTVNGGVINADGYNSGIAIEFNGETSPSAVINGGSFTQGSTSYGIVRGAIVTIPDGYEWQVTEDGYYTVSPYTGDTVATVNGTGYATLRAAFAAVADGSTVLLAKDYTMREVVGLGYQCGAEVVGKSVTFDLNGHTLTVDDTSGGSSFALIYVHTGAALTLTDSGEGGTIDIQTGSTYAIRNCGDFTMAGGTIQSVGYGIESKPYYYYCYSDAQIASYVSTTTTINGGTIIGTSSSADVLRVDNATGCTATLTISDVDFTGTILLSGTSTTGVTATIAGGTFTAGTTSSSVIEINHGSSLTINGGTFSAADDSYSSTDLITIQSDGGTLVINDGEFTSADAVVYVSNYSSSSSRTFSVTLNGGIYMSDENSSIVYVSSSSSSAETTVEVSGGTYSADVSDYATATVVTTTNGDGDTVYIVVETVDDAVAAVFDADGNYTGSYTTLKTAYAAVADGGSMVILKDVDGEQLGASSEKAVTLDLSGHTISRSSGSVIDNSKCVLTIIDSSQTESSIGTGAVTGSGGVALKLSGGSVILKSGTLQSTSTYAVTMSGGALTVDSGAVITASSANCIFYYTGGTLTINDGLFTVADRESTVSESEVISGAIVNAGSSAAVDDKNVQVAITGGVFQTYRPLLGTSINLEITGGYFLSKYSLNNYTPDGYGYTSGSSCTYLGVTYSSYYKVAHTNFTLTVMTSGDSPETTTSYYATLVQAVNAAISAYDSNSSATITITLENDYETGKVPVEKAVKFTLDLNGYTLTSTDKGAFKIGNSDAEVTITDSSKAGTGTITTVDSDSEYLTSSTTGLLQVVSGTLYITGGNFNQNAGNSVFVVSSDGTVSLTGGTYAAEADPGYCASGYAVRNNGDGTYTVVASDVVFNGEEVFMCGHDVVIESQSGDDDDTNLILTYTDEDGYEYQICYTSDTAARVFGGYLTPTGTTTDDTYKITLNSGTVGSLRGGSKGFSSLNNISFDSAEIIVNGGTAGIIASGWYYNQSANTFTVTVNGGTVTTIYGNGETSYVASQYIQSLIDTMLKSSSYSADDLAAMAEQYDFISAVKDDDGDTAYMYVPTVGTADIAVTGGTVTYVYGGGKACTQNGSYTAYTSKDFSMVTNEANITISGDAAVTYVNGGSFSGPEANWGETSGQDTVIVNTANITVSGGEITNLFSGGYNGQWKFTYKINADGELVFSNYNGTNEDEEVRNIVNTANVTVNDGGITNLFMGGRSYAYVGNSNLTVNGGTIGTLSTSGNYGYVENIDADVTGGTITKLELLNRNYVGDIDLDVTGGTVVAFYAGTGGAYKNSNCNEATYNISTMAILGDVDVNFDGVAPGAAYLTTGLEYAGDVSINVQLTLIAMNLAADSGYTGSNSTSGSFVINNEDTTWTATIYVDGDGVSFDRNGHSEKTLVILPVKLGVSSNASSSVTAESVVDYGESTMYVEVSADNISEYYSTSAYPTTDLTFTEDETGDDSEDDGGDGDDSNSKDDGDGDTTTTHSYIFAGWYSSEDGETFTAMTDIPTSDAYAKFVDADMIAIKCVLTPHADSGYNTVRFVSSLDTDSYHDMAFIVTNSEETEVTTLTKSTLIGSYYTVSSVSCTFYPTDFSKVSKYIVTNSFKDTNQMTAFTVTPRIKTLDGTLVYGEPVTFNITGSTASVY